MRGSTLIGILVTLVVVEAVASYFNQMFWPSQVVTHWNQKGIAFFAHAGMWSDLLILPILFAYIVDNFGSEWTGTQMMQMAVIGALVAGGNNLLLMFTQEVPDPIGWKKEWISITIVLHFFYMGLLVAIVGLFYFFSKANIMTIVLVSVALGIHMMAGMHVFTGLLQRFIYLKGCPDFLAGNQSLYMSAGVWIALAALATYAGGLRAGIIVAVAAVVVAAVLFTGLMISDSRPQSA
jgi:hypothetical protein